jgi:glucose-1-phosphate thymidylyltransferase
VSNHRFAESFRAWAAALAARAPGARVEVIDDGATTDASRLGAVRDLALALERQPARETTLVAAGDNLFRFRLDAFLDDHARRPRNLVLVQREIDPARLRRSGVAVLGEGGRVLRFVEKPARPPSEWSCPPLYLLEPEALARVPEFLREVPDADPPGALLAWLAEREPVFAHEMQGHRHDVGDPASHARAEAWLDEVERGGQSSGRKTTKS